MSKITLAMFLMAGMSAWGQAQNFTSSKVSSVDRAAAYYHYTLARMYVEKTWSSPDDRKAYKEKAVEHFKAAIQADPKSPVTKLELAGIFLKPYAPPSPWYLDPPTNRSVPPVNPASPTIDPLRKRPSRP